MGNMTVVLIFRLFHDMVNLMVTDSPETQKDRAVQPTSFLQYMSCIHDPAMCFRAVFFL